MRLYFLGSNNKRYLVGVKIEGNRDELQKKTLQKIEKDIPVRRPKYADGYRRTWWDDDGQMWVDFGSHTEFYVLMK